MNELYKQFQGNYPNNPMMERLMQFKKNFKGNPRDIVQQMLNNGRISQDQFNRYAQQANELYQQFKNFM